MNYSLYTMIIGSFVLSHCTKEKIVYRYITITEAAQNNSSPSPTSNTDISLSGSLKLGSSATTALSLAAGDTYSLYCVTFDDTPSGFAVPTTVDGNSYKFDQKLPDLAGRAFGCFLRKNDKTESTVEFEQGSTLVAGRGNLVLDMDYDPVTKLSKASIDSTQSTAMFSDAIAAAKSTRGSTTTAMGDISGQYSVSCEEDSANGLSCDALGKSFPTSIYLSQFEALEKPKVAMWESLAKKNMCVPSGATDAKPKFGFGLSAADQDFMVYDFRGDTELDVAMENVWTYLKSASPTTPAGRLKNAISQKVGQNVSWRLSQCTDLDSQFSDSTCRFVPTTYNTYSYWDPTLNKETTQKTPQWYSQFCGQGETPEVNYCAGPDYSGSVVAKATACTNYWSPDTPMCPADTDVDDSGKGIFTSYFATVGTEQIPLRLVCKRTSDSWISYQDLAKASSKSASIAVAKASLGCDSIGTGAFSGLRELEKKATVNALVELSMYPVYNSTANICRNRQLPPGFSFASCAENPESPDWSAMWDRSNPQYTSDQSVALFCFSMNSRYSSLNVMVDRTLNSPTYGKLINNPTQTDYISEWDGQEYCPTAYQSFQASPRDATDWDNFSNACHAAILTMSLSDQLSAAMRSTIGVWDVIPYVACSDATGTARANLQAGFDRACLPQANMTMMCDSTGTCSSKLRCDGTDKGKCYSGDVFIGRIAGRLGVMDVKPSVNKAFELGSSIVDQFASWNPTGTPSGGNTANGAMEQCSVVNSTILNATQSSNGFNGFYKNRVKKSCEPLPSGTGMMQGTAAAGGSSGKNNDVQKMPEIDLMMKLKFTKQ